MTRYPRLTFPDQFFPIHIDWLPSEFNNKVSHVQLSIHQNQIYTPRPPYSLLRSNDLQSHSTIYQRLSAVSPRSTPSLPSSSSSSKIFFDLYTPRKSFRKSEPGFPDYHLRIQNGDDAFHFDELYHDQQERRTLTAVVHQGDISFYSVQSFDPIVALQSN